MIFSDTYQSITLKRRENVQIFSLTERSELTELAYRFHRPCRCSLWPRPPPPLEADARSRWFRLLSRRWKITPNRARRSNEKSFFLFLSYFTHLRELLLVFFGTITPIDAWTTERIEWSRAVPGEPYLGIRNLDRETDGGEGKMAGHSPRSRPSNLCFRRYFTADSANFFIVLSDLTMPSEPFSELTPSECSYLQNLSFPCPKRKRATDESVSQSLFVEQGLLPNHRRPAEFSGFCSHSSMR